MTASADQHVASLERQAAIKNMPNMCSCGLRSAIYTKKNLAEKANNEVYTYV